MTDDIPSFTEHEIRALVYLHEVEMQRDEEKPPIMSELEELTDWHSKYWTRSWKRLQPKGLINRVKDGQASRLALTEKGRLVANKFMQINEVLEE